MTAGSGGDNPPPPQRLSRSQALVGIGVLVASALLAWGAIDISGEAGYSGVGPNFLPWVVTAALAVCGVLLVWHAVQGGFRNFPEPSGAPRGDWVDFVWVSAGLLANAALITKIGFVLSCTLCYVLAVRGFRRSTGRDDWRVSTLLLDLLTGLAIAAPVYWMFGKLLAISLPGLTDTGWI